MALLDIQNLSTVFDTDMGTVKVVDDVSFKIEKGEISRIEAIFIRGPYGINSGWSTYEQGRSEEIQDVR